DRLLQLDAGRSGAGEYRVRGDEAFLRGHFPGQPMMPGVLLTEALAQLAGVVAQSDPAIPPLRGLRLTALRNVKILGTAVPGEVLRIEAKVAGRLANLVQASGSIYVADRLILSGDVTLSGEAQ
ncbi:MAG TPA: beta-hydroxyacyl-ACP dehydratase, partial [Phycisphaerae bacterium]|nr:beta-hydroxyacyl-ACP dehydratase [Phycisphaerae bacterium]